MPCACLRIPDRSGGPSPLSAYFKCSACFQNEFESALTGTTATRNPMRKWRYVRSLYVRYADRQVQPGPQTEPPRSIGDRPLTTRGSTPPGDFSSQESTSLCRSRHHSAALPCMSCRPHGFGFLSPTSWGYISPLALPSPLRPPHQAYSLSCVSSSPNEYAVVVPARHAYSHCASVG